jgi:hypothetical protein
MSELEIDLNESLVNMFWWNLKFFKRTLSRIEKKQNFYSNYILRSWEVKTKFKGHPGF